MIKGLYSAASAMIAQMTQQQVLAHNSANVDTPGFKQIMTSLDEFMQTAVSTTPGDGSQTLPTYLGQLGLGVDLANQTTDQSLGAIQNTGHNMDFAIDGSGFFRIKTPSGERYTRDGRFNRDSSGKLVTIDGFQVLNKSGSAITLPEGDILVSEDGSITVNGSSVAQIGLASFKDPSKDLARDGTNNFKAINAPSTAASSSTIHQGYLEQSNVNASQLMTQMVMVARSYEAAQQMMTNQDSLLSETINTLGRF
jgi:flagellar basal-body rod protein FlgF